MNRSSRRRAAADERRTPITISLPGGEQVTGRPEDVARRLQAHILAADPDMAHRLAIRAAGAAWAAKQQRKHAAETRSSPPEPVVLPPGTVNIDRLQKLMWGDMRKELRR